MYQRFRLPAMRRGELSPAVTQLMSFKCLWSRWKWKNGYKEIVPYFTCCPVNREYSGKKSLIEKKSKARKANYALQHVRTDSRCMWMKSVLNLSWPRFLLYMNWFLYAKNLRHESVNALLLACIHCDDKIIDMYISKYQRQMLLIINRLK